MRVGPDALRRRSPDAAAVETRPEARESRFLATSGRQALTALSATSSEDGSAGTSAHAQPEAMGLCAAAIVRLERALAHSGTPVKKQFGGSTGRKAVRHRAPKASPA